MSFREVGALGKEKEKKPVVRIYSCLGYLVGSLDAGAIYKSGFTYAWTYNG